MQIAIEPKTKADLEKMQQALFKLAQEDPSFQRDLDSLLTDYAGRPTPLYRCRNLCAETPATI